MIKALRGLLGRHSIILVGSSSFLIRLAALGATFLTGVLVARLLGPADYGRFGLVISLSALAATLPMIGTPQLAVREISIALERNDRAKAAALVGGYLFLVGILSVTLIAISIVIGVALGSDRHDLFLIAAGALLAMFAALIGLMSGILRAFGSLNRGQIVEVAARPLLTVLLYAGLLLASSRITLALAVGVQVVAAGLGVLLLVNWLRRAMTAPLHLAASALPAGWLKAALPLCAVDFLRQLDGAYGLILLGLLASDSEVGFYRVALSCAVILSMPATIFHITLAPRIAPLLANRDERALTSLFATVSLVLFGVLGLGTLAVWLIGQPLLILAFGAQYASAYGPLLLLSIAWCASGLFGMGPIALAMGSSENVLIRIYLIAIICGAIVSFAAIEVFGATGAALGQLVSLFLTGLLSELHCRRKWGLSLLPTAILLRRAPFSRL